MSLFFLIFSFSNSDRHTHSLTRARIANTHTHTHLSNKGAHTHTHSQTAMQSKADQNLFAFLFGFCILGKRESSISIPIGPRIILSKALGKFFQINSYEYMKIIEFARLLYWSCVCSQLQCLNNSNRIFASSASDDLL